MGRPSFSPPLTSNFSFYAYSWQGKAGWIFPHPINHMNKSFSPPDNVLHEVYVKPCQGGEEWVGPVFPHPRKSKGYMCIRDRVRLAVFFPDNYNLPYAQPFPPPDNLLNMVDFKPRQGGEKLGRPSFSPPQD